MKLTKYEHACFTVEKDGQLLVIDPGSYTTDFISPSNVVGIVITHIHADHLDQELIASIIDKNPGAIIIGDTSVTSTIEAFQTKTVSAGHALTAGPFSLEFFGGAHAAIYDAFPAPPNLSVLIDELLYYPGDSLYIPAGRSIDTLALPVAAPWLKLSDALDFLIAVSPRAAFPTHDAILSTVGKDLVDQLISLTANAHDITYTRQDSLMI